MFGCLLCKLSNIYFRENRFLGFCEAECTKQVGVQVSVMVDVSRQIKLKFSYEDGKPTVMKTVKEAKVHSHHSTRHLLIISYSQSPKILVLDHQT